jgi:perosamine synthetase
VTPEVRTAAPARDIPLCVPQVAGNEARYFQECLDTNFVSSVGPFVDRFEEIFARRIGTRRAVATVNGTSALHIALLVAGVRPDDEVLISTLTFIAPVNAIRYAGAWPIFIDAEPEYWQLDPARVGEFLERRCEWSNGELRNRASGRRVRAIVPVHILGHPVETDSILELARRYRLVVIEDATESLGAFYKGRTVGHLGDIACFSFNGNKLITTGGGGMIVTDDEAMGARAKYLTTQAKDDAIEFVHGAVGYNYRLPNLLAAMGCAQMERLDEYLEAKRRIAKRYRTALAAVPGLTPMPEAAWATSAWWMYTVLVDRDRFGMDSRALLARLERDRIQSRPLWQPAHLSPSQRDAPAADCPVAERLNRDALSLPCSVGLSEADQERVIEAVRAAGRE